MLSNKLVASIRDLFDFDKAFEIFKDKAYSEIGKFIFETFTSLGGGFFELWDGFADSFNGYMDGTYRGTQGVAKAVLDFEIDFENGHFWGGNKYETKGILL